MEATGHYWRNLFTALVTAGFKITLIIRCARYAKGVYSICLGTLQFLFSELATAQTRHRASKALSNCRCGANGIGQKACPVLL